MEWTRRSRDDLCLLFQTTSLHSATLDSALFGSLTDTTMCLQDISSDQMIISGHWLPDDNNEVCQLSLCERLRLSGTNFQGQSQANLSALKFDFSDVWSSWFSEPEVMNEVDSSLVHHSVDKYIDSVSLKWWMKSTQVSYIIQLISLSILIQWAWSDEWSQLKLLTRWPQSEIDSI